MLVARSSGLSIVLGLALAGCGGNGGSGTTGGGGSTTASSTTAASSGTASASSGTASASSGTASSSSSSSSTTSTSGTTTTTTIFMCPGPNGCMATVCPPELQSLANAASGPGLTLTWTEAQPCDTVEIEWRIGLMTYPSDDVPPDPPQFSVPGTMMSITDMAATNTNTYVYHSRCVVSGVNSCWSNELSSAGHP